MVRVWERVEKRGEERRGEQRGCTWLVWKRDVDVEVEMEEAWKKKNGVDALQEGCKR
jgi:hypothetical protein